MSNLKIKNSLEEASKIIGITWPLYSFVTSNPLVGFENMEFSEAMKEATKLFGKKCYPTHSVFKQAVNKGEIDLQEVEILLKINGIALSPKASLEKLESKSLIQPVLTNSNLDIILSKWLSAFMDEGLAAWEMPDKSLGFYASWRNLAPFDSELNIKNKKEIPVSAEENLEILLQEFSEKDILDIFKQHLAALPGWTGYIKHRSQYETNWQKKFPISLSEYLSVRLLIAKKLNIPFLQLENAPKVNNDILDLQHLWLQAWENTWQKTISKDLASEIIDDPQKSEKIKLPHAQFAFCIDTRSELMRRHLEKVGNYETFGYAGFFGIAMDYQNKNDGIIKKACPPIVDSAYLVSEIPKKNNSEKTRKFEEKIERKRFTNYFLSRLKNMLPSAFGYVEGSGLLYSMALANRTLLSGYNYRRKNKNATDYEKIYEPKINNYGPEASALSLETKAAIVKGAFETTGWTTFAPLIIFVGHGSHTANNPFGSSLDCGACAANPGRHNARMLAKLANEVEVQQILKEKFDIHIPENTLFLGAEHNTTTDEIILFDADLTLKNTDILLQLKEDLALVQINAAEERLKTTKNNIEQGQKNANNWAETRPEWGLAKNATFLIGPRKLSKNLNLDGKCFLQSYDHQEDPEGNNLEAIMQGPMVVTQWINNHYYFSTVDNDGFGGGSKITHNITGKFGVVQGNGGDLKFGLPLESVNQSDHKMYHQPLRLSVIIQAPIPNIEKILLRNAHLTDLVNNGWIYLLVMDPQDGDQIKKYSEGMNWEPLLETELKEKKHLKLEIIS